MCLSRAILPPRDSASRKFLHRHVKYFHNLLSVCIKLTRLQSLDCNRCSIIPDSFVNFSKLAMSNLSYESKGRLRDLPLISCVVRKPNRLWLFHLKRVLIYALMYIRTPKPLIVYSTISDNAIRDRNQQAVICIDGLKDIAV